MSQALVAFEANGVEVDEAVTKRFRQYLSLSITGLATDTVYDFAADTSGSLGTFWTAAIADATYGATASLGLSVLQSIQPLIKTFLGILGPITSLYSSTSGGSALQSLAGTVGSGSATPSITVTGLQAAAADKILAVTQTGKGANSLALLGWNTQAAGSLVGVYSADPGAGGTVSVLVQRISGTVTPPAGSYNVAITGNVPSLTFASGSAPTATTIVLWWDLLPGTRPVKYPIP